MNIQLSLGTIDGSPDVTSDPNRVLIFEQHSQGSVELQIRTRIICDDSDAKSTESGVVTERNLCIKYVSLEHFRDPSSESYLHGCRHVDSYIEFVIGRNAYNQHEAIELLVVVELLKCIELPNGRTQLDALIY